MTRYQPHSRRELRALFKTWLGLNRSRVAVFLALMIGLIVVETWCLSVVHLPTAMRWYVTGFVHAAVIGVIVAAVMVVFLTQEARAVHQVRGAWGEDFTRDELRRARRKKLIWGWVDSVTVDGGDIDHLVVTKSGGIVAIDSKWRSATTEHGPLDMARDAKKVKLRAEAVVRSLLRPGSRGGHRAAASPLQITPLVTVWGPSQKPIPDGARVDGIEFVGGNRLVDWLARVDGERVDEAAAADVLARLEQFRSTAWRSRRT